MLKVVTYLRAHWSGDLPQGLSLVVNFTLGLVVSQSIVYFGFSYLSWSHSVSVKVFLSYLLTLSLIIFVWGLVGAVRRLEKEYISVKISLCYLYLIIASFKLLKFFYYTLRDSVAS